SPVANFTFDPVTGKFNGTSPATVADPAAVNFDLTALTAYGGANTAEAVSADGTSMGALSSYSISSDGTIEGVFTNGRRQPLGQIAMATFNNPAGLNKVGNS